MINYIPGDLALTVRSDNIAIARMPFRDADGRSAGILIYWEDEDENFAMSITLG
jgi:hypothetical protein